MKPATKECQPTSDRAAPPPSTRACSASSSAKTSLRTAGSRRAKPCSTLCGPTAPLARRRCRRCRCRCHSRSSTADELPTVGVAAALRRLRRAARSPAAELALHASARRRRASRRATPRSPPSSPRSSTTWPSTAGARWLGLFHARTFATIDESGEADCGCSSCARVPARADDVEHADSASRWRGRRARHPAQRDRRRTSIAARVARADERDPSSRAAAPCVLPTPLAVRGDALRDGVRAAFCPRPSPTSTTSPIRSASPRRRRGRRPRNQMAASPSTRRGRRRSATTPRPRRRRARSRWRRVAAARGGGRGTEHGVRWRRRRSRHRFASSVCCRQGARRGGAAG